MILSRMPSRTSCNLFLTSSISNSLLFGSCSTLDLITLVQLKALSKIEAQRAASSSLCLMSSLHVADSLFELPDKSLGAESVKHSIVQPDI